MKLRKGDEVVVLAGKDIGKRGRHACCRSASGIVTGRLITSSKRTEAEERDATAS
jgi:ribosomal protein L24